MGTIFRTFCLFLAVLFAASAIPAFSSYCDAGDPIGADLNEDGRVDRYDVAILLQVLSGSDSRLPGSSDPDRDGIVSVKDLTMLVNLMEKEGTDEMIRLTQEDIDLFRGSYEILRSRITGRGYAVTSLTGTYVGMFMRDSAIQAMAHIAAGDREEARSILRYLFFAHSYLGLQKAAHIVDELREEEYGNQYLARHAVKVNGVYDSQTNPGDPQLLLNAPGNAAATPFITDKSLLSSVQVFLQGAPGATVTAQILSDLYDEKTLIASGQYVFSDGEARFCTIPLYQSGTIVPGATYYLKLFAPSASGKVVWYGVTSAASQAKKTLNYDLNAYGGNGWREVNVYAAFSIDGAEKQDPENNKTYQRYAETALYLLNAPGNAAAQPFVAASDTIYAVELHLAATKPTDTVFVSLCTDYRDPATSIAQAQYTFNKRQNGWQSIGFDSPVRVIPGKTYYLLVQASASSGRVVWNGTTTPCGVESSRNYDVNAFGGWVEKPYYPAFEILSYPTQTVACAIPARGETIRSVALDLFAFETGGRVRAEIRSGLGSGNVLGSVEETIDFTGEKSCSLSFDPPVPAPENGETYLVVTFYEAAARLMRADEEGETAYALIDGRWRTERVGLAADVIFDTDEAPLIVLTSGTSATQEIPSFSETITSVKLLLKKDPGVTGRLAATLSQGKNGDSYTVGTSIDLAEVQENAGWVTAAFDLPLTRADPEKNYYLTLSVENATGNVFWCGSTGSDRYETYETKNGVSSSVAGEAGFRAMRAFVRLISDYTQTDTTYMLLHAWAMLVGNENRSQEDLAFAKESYPLVKTFANYYLNRSEYFNKRLNLLFNPSLEHSRQGRYWKSYDLITNVFASQALYEISAIAQELQDVSSADKWKEASEKITKGIREHLTTQIDGKTIYGEFYDTEDKMRFYQGFSWVNLAPVAAQWYGTDATLMKNTFDLYKEAASLTFFQHTALATDATYGGDEIRREWIGKGVAWELMYRSEVRDTDRVAEILSLERDTAKRYRLTVYPESWIADSTVSDPGNQEHCAWQVYAMLCVFPGLAGEIRQE